VAGPRTRSVVAAPARDRALYDTWKRETNNQRTLTFKRFSIRKKQQGFKRASGGATPGTPARFGEAACVAPPPPHTAMNKVCESLR
jgi:hypothetical protein